MAQNRNRPNGNDDNTRPAAASFVHNMVASSVFMILSIGMAYSSLPSITSLSNANSSDFGDHPSDAIFEMSVDE